MNNNYGRGSMRGGNTYGRRPHGGGRGRGRGRGGGGRGRGGRGRNNNNNNNHNNRPPVKDMMRNDQTMIEEIRCTATTTTNSANSNDNSNIASPPCVRMAVEGCCHGELEAIYERLQRHEQESNRRIDLLVCCGDFESLRNLADLHSIAVPSKYLTMGSFYKYYSGQLTAPYLTIFVAGNHESSQSLQELYYGGWVAPNIYYMGAAGVVNYGGVRIGGISGIYKEHDYHLGRHEVPPYDRSTLRSIYHVRNVEVYQMSCLSQSSSSLFQPPLDVMISHDWPQGIEQHGDTQGLLRRKPFFRSEVEQNNLGSPANHQLLQLLKPKWWVAAHLHVKFRATVRHSNQPNDDNDDQKQSAIMDVTSLVPTSTIGGDTKKRKAPGSDEMASPDAKDTSETLDAPGSKESMETTTQFVAPAEDKTTCDPTTLDLTEQMTQFLSLDKCLPRRHFLTIVDVPVAETVENPKLEYDLEWLAVLRKTHHLMSNTRQRVQVPSEFMRVDDSDIHWIEERLSSRQIPENFVATVPPIASETHVDPLPRTLPPPFAQMGNPQTDQLLQLLELDHLVTVPYKGAIQSNGGAASSEIDTARDDNEISIDADDEMDGDGKEATQESADPAINDDNEIDLED